jgi:hypothetical protein
MEKGSEWCRERLLSGNGAAFEIRKLKLKIRD